MMLTALLLATASPPHGRDDDDEPRASRLVAPSAVSPKRSAPAVPIEGDDDEDDEKPRAKRAVAPVPPIDEDDDDEEEEGGRIQPNSTIVVTARKLDAARTQIDVGLGATVYSLSNDAIENRPGGETGSVASILEQAPGVTLSGRTLNVRGAPTNQVRINNVIVPEAISDPADQLSSRLAQTTRLITGTLPAQFGFAPGGVISVTTKNGLYQHGGQAELFAGSDGMIEPALEWAGSIDRTSLFGSGSLERDRSRVGDGFGQHSRDRGLAVEGLGFADHVIDNENRVSVIFGGALERHRIGSTSIGAGREWNGNAYSVATFQHSNGGFNLQASAFGGIATDRADFIEKTRERRGSWGTQIDGSQANGPHTLRFGLLATRSTERQEAGGIKARLQARTSLSLYVQDEWKLASTLTFNPGARAEWLEGFGAGATVEPRASLVWAPADGLTAHVGYARYAVAPPVGEKVAAALLHDERDDYFDAGVQQKFGAFTVGLDGYWRSARNYLVERHVIGSALTEPFQFERGRLRGVELSGTYGLHGTNAWANLALSRSEGMTIVGGDQLYASPVVPLSGDEYVSLTTDRPVRITAGLTQRAGRLTLAADALISSGAVRTQVATDPNGSRHSAYAVFGLAAVYHARIADRPADLRLDLTNVGNAQYETNDATSVEGDWTRYGRPRAITIGIEQSF